MPMIEVTVTEDTLNRECEEIAKDVFEDVFGNRDFPDDPDDDPEDWREEMMERVREIVDGHRWLIYNRYPLEMLLTCNTDHGEEFAADVGTGDGDVQRYAATVAYGEMVGRIAEALDDLIREYEPPERAEEDEDEEEEA